MLRPMGAVHCAHPVSPESPEPSWPGHLCLPSVQPPQPGPWAPRKLQRTSSHGQKHLFKGRLYSYNFSSTQQLFPFLCTVWLSLRCWEGSSSWEWQEMAPAVWQGSFSPYVYFSSASFYLLYLFLKVWTLRDILG